jgi:hypothetical protein
MKTLGDIFNQVIVRSGITTTSAYFTDTIVKDWINDAYMWASAYHKWPMTEGRVSTTYASGTGANSDEYFFEGYKADSFRFLKIGSNRFQKLNFEDYQNYLEENPQGQDKVFSDFGKLVYINPNSGASGTTVAYGQFQPTLLDLTDHTAETVFSSYDTEANEAICNKALSFLKLREMRMSDADYFANKAIEQLENVLKRYEGEQSAYQTKNRGMFKRVDVLGGDYYDELFRRDQF